MDRRKSGTGVCRDCGKRIKSTSSRCRPCNDVFLRGSRCGEPPEPADAVEVSGYILSPEAAERFRTVQRVRTKYGGMKIPFDDPDAVWLRTTYCAYDRQRFRPPQPMKKP